LVVPDPAGHAVDLVADVEPVDAGTQLDHGPGEVDAEDGRCHHLRGCRVADLDLEVERVHRAGGHPDENLAGAGNGAGDVT
jgi:hypothetical protein